MSAKSPQSQVMEEMWATGDLVDHWTEICRRARAELGPDAEFGDILKLAWKTSPIARETLSQSIKAMWEHPEQGPRMRQVINDSWKDPERKNRRMQLRKKRHTEHQCDECGAVFISQTNIRGKHRFCSTKCCNRATHRRRPKRDHIRVNGKTVWLPNTKTINQDGGRGND